MATRDPSGIELSLLPESEREHFRLLELPPELLALFTSENAPTLQLKSREASGANANDATVVLCTPDRTYDLRQVSTSNSVYLTRPSQSGMRAISKCDSTMEVLSTPRQTAESYMRAVLPVYSSSGHLDAQKSISKHDLFSHIPLSEAECEEGWSRLACFESSDPPGSYIPSAKVRAQVWDNLFTVATAERLDLTLCPTMELLNAAAELRETWPSELLSDILASISVRRDDILAIDADKCVRFVGLSNLQASSEGRAIDTVSFLEAWRDAVPEDWRSKCGLPVLNGAYKTSDAGKIITSFDAAGPSDGAADGQGKDVKSSLGAKRKWHEKFRASKKS